MPSDIQNVPYVSQDGQVATYSAALSAYTPYATATDMLVLSNPAVSNYMLRVSQVRISGIITAAATVAFYLVIRSALNTGGTSTAVPTIGRHDISDQAPQGAPVTYSVAPTLNGTAYIIRSDYMVLGTALTPVALNPIIWQFGDRGGAKQLRIRPGQQASISFNGGTVGAGTSLAMAIEWTETTPIQ
jgi:hypothetical protein